MEVGCQSMVGPLQKVLVKRPEAAFVDGAQIAAQWSALGFTAAPDLAAATLEYQAFSEALGALGAELHFQSADARTTLDSIYAHDSSVVSDQGVILVRMGKAQRRSEVEVLAEWCAAHQVPVLGRIEGAGRLEGGDVCWLDRRTVAVGEGYRSNAEGIRQLALLLGDAVDEVIPVPLPHWRGEAEVLHLLSIISPVDHDLAVVYPRLMPVPFLQRLRARGMQLVEVPDEEYDSMGCNVLALAPRQCLMIEGNPTTRKRLEAAGATVVTYRGDEISRKGCGGPTCLTRPLLRG